LEDNYGVKKMRVAVDVLGSVREPYFEVHHEHVVGMQLRPSFIEMGLRLSLGISDDALMAICDGMSGEVELRHEAKSFCLRRDLALTEDAT
jgi:hypothetical protein